MSSTATPAAAYQAAVHDLLALAEAIAVTDPPNAVRTA